MRTQTVSVVIANGASLSSICDLTEVELLGVFMPAAWTAAHLSFQTTAPTPPDLASGDVFQNVFDGSGAEVDITTLVSQAVMLTAAQRDALVGLGRTKVRSGLSGAAVAQGAARTLQLIVRPR